MAYEGTLLQTMNDSNTLCSASFWAFESLGPAVKTASCASVLMHAANSGCLRRCTAISDNRRKPHLRGDQRFRPTLGHDLRGIHTNTTRDHELKGAGSHIASNGVSAMAISGL